MVDVSIISVEEELVFDVPVALIFYKRKGELLQVIDALRHVKPSKVYLISDGPKNDAEKKIVYDTRILAEKAIDWNCVVIKDYSEKNLGCKYRPYLGISNAFENEDRLIILEDDIVPDVSFFNFCRLLLEEYKDDDRIMQISGFNPFNTSFNDDRDYYFSHFPPIWGWATWKRAWNKIDIEMIGLEESVNNRELRANYTSERFYWYHMRAYLEHKNMDSWAFPWGYAKQKNHGFGVVPKFNLIKNIGFDANATHTNKNDRAFSFKTSHMSFPINIRKSVEWDVDYEKEYERRNSGAAWKYLIKRYVLKGKPIRIKL